jgi:diaminopimelate decarboxylase
MRPGARLAGDPPQRLRVRSADEVAELLPYLESRDGELAFAGGERLSRLLPEGGAAIVYVPARAVDNYRSIREAFAAEFPRSRVAVALKACYQPRVVRALVEDGAGLEVMSGQELDLALAAGCPSGAIVSNGVGLRAGHIQVALLAGALIVVDNLDDLASVERHAAEQGVRARLGLRVSPDVRMERFIGRGSKLGCDWRGGGFLELVDAALATRWCDLTTLHAHQLSHCHDVGTYRRAIRGVAEVAGELVRALGVRFETIDIGGGFDSRYLVEANGQTAAAFAAAAAAELAPVPYEFELVVEPGRYVTADAAVGLTTVTGEKRNGGRRWRITSLGSNVLIPLPDIAYHPVPMRWPGDGEPWAEFDVGDGTCAPTVLARDVELPAGPAGRELAVLNVGAYTTVFAESWAFPLPDIQVWDGAELTTHFGREQRAAMFGALHGQAVPAGC